MTAMYHVVRTTLALGLVTVSPSISFADEIDDAAADGANFATQAFPDATVDQDGNVSIGGGSASAREFDARGSISGCQCR